MFKLLRPELVKAFPRPLCSDAFSKFLIHDQNRRELNGDIVHATWFLKNEIIPTVAALFSTMGEEELKTLPLPLFLHNYGINLRYMGLFYKHVEVDLNYHNFSFFFLLVLGQMRKCIR